MRHALHALWCIVAYAVSALLGFYAGLLAYDAQLYPSTMGDGLAEAFVTLGPIFVAGAALPFWAGVALIRERRLWRPLCDMGVAAAISFAYVVLLVSPFMINNVMFALLFAATWLVCGATMGLTYWLLARCPRPPYSHR